LNEGIVIKSTGSWYHVRDDNGAVIECRIIGKFRLNGLGLTNPVAVGDKVQYEIEAEGKGIVKKIDKRVNYVVRQSPRRKHQLHLLASNIDEAIVIMTIIQPNLKQGFIDRFLLMTEPHDIPVTIVFNKRDIGIKDLATQLKGKTTLVCGQSGVGKSSLLKALDPSLDIKVQEISDHSGKGQHTTTFAEMHTLEDAYIIDTPGIKTLSFNNLSPQDVAHNFREIFKKSEDCKFGNCMHINEPGCAVKEGIEVGEISELRYENYLKILQEVEDQNYWERHTHM